MTHHWPTVGILKANWCFVVATNDASLFIQCITAFQKKKQEFWKTQQCLIFIGDKTFSFLIILPKEKYYIKHSQVFWLIQNLTVCLFVSEKDCISYQ